MKKYRKLFKAIFGIALAGCIYFIVPSQKYIAINTDYLHGFDNCDISKNLEIPKLQEGIPNKIIIRTGYTTSYNCGTKNPNWVAWCLTKEHINGRARRSKEKFTADEDVMSPKADTYDYSRTGFDRGHMCPAGDNKWSNKAMKQSFLMTNICPQNKGLNRGSWNEIEQLCRKWAKKYGKLYIACGPIYFHGYHRKIGTHKIWVPDAFFKCILCLENKPKAIGFICKNEDGKHKKNVSLPVDDVERITGIDFFSNLPDELENRIEKTANLREWK